MQYLTKKEYFKIDALWKRIFLEDVKKSTGKYTRAGSGRSDWVILAWLRDDVWLDASAVSRYEAQAVPDLLYVWTDEWYAKVSERKLNLDELWGLLEEGADAVYLASFSTGISWTFVITHEDLPCRYIYSEKASEEEVDFDFVCQI